MPQRYNNSRPTAKQNLETELSNFLQDTDALDVNDTLLTLLGLAAEGELSQEQTHTITYAMRLFNAMARVQKDSLKMKMAM